jgi:hypothetical protein
MKTILVTGVTETHTNHPDRASSTKFVSIPELMREGLQHLGHKVDHRAVVPGEDLSAYDVVFVYLYPLDGNALHPDGAIYALTSRPDAYVCLDDWAFQKIIPTWQDKLPLDELQKHVWLAPLFPWGNIQKMQLPIPKIKAWDPSPLYVIPPAHTVQWGKRKLEWYNASLSSDAHNWATSQNLTWPVHSIGGKSLGQPRKLEKDIVWEYGEYVGILCPTYAHAGCGWWRVRYLHAAAAGCVLGGNPLEFANMGPAYSFTLRGLETMSLEQLGWIATAQAMSLKPATITKTLNDLESYTYDHHLGRA